jgi:hypothetical protein
MVRYQLTDDTPAVTVLCAISGQTTQQQVPYRALSANRRHSSRHHMVRYQLTDDTPAGTVRCAVSGQTTQQQVPYRALSANREATTVPPVSPLLVKKPLGNFPISQFPTLPFSHYRSCQYIEYCISSTCFSNGNVSL